jgi:hypothetical protein
MDHLQEQRVYDLLSAADLVKRTAPVGHTIREAGVIALWKFAEI